MGVRAKQWLIACLGGAITLTMLWLGLWQMRVFEDRENESAAARAAQPPVALLDFVAADGTVGDVYGKRVTATGRYLATQQVAVVAEDGAVRVLTAFQLSDGRVLPVVRGTLPAGAGSAGTPDAGPGAASLSAPPVGEITLTGLFLPSEAGSDAAVPPGTLASVRLPGLAQAWPQQLLPGFVTLSEADSAAQGLGAAATSLPSGEGSIQNAGYALQWWVFAAFAAFMTLRFVRTIGRDGKLGTLAAEEEA